MTATAYLPLTTDPHNRNDMQHPCSNYSLFAYFLLNYVYMIIAQKFKT